MSDETETKIVVTHRGKGATLGVQRTNSDPILFTAQGDLSTVIGNITCFLEEAGSRWQINPRYPKADIPIPVPTQTVPALNHQAARSQNKQQEAMF